MEPGCTNPVRSKGWCHGHYMREWNRIHRPKRVCSYPGCDSFVEQRQGRIIRCGEHRTSCALLECERPRYKGEWCTRHRSRVRASGEPGEADRRTKDRRYRKDSDGTQWYLSDEGYIYRLVKTGNRKYRYVWEHREIMETLLARPLRDQENVHHLNGDRADNRQENLELWSTQQPPGQRIIDKVEWAKEILLLYGEEVEGGLHRANRSDAACA